jgi:hypothetical protein
MVLAPWISPAPTRGAAVASALEVANSGESKTSAISLAKRPQRTERSEVRSAEFGRETATRHRHA